MKAKSSTSLPRILGVVGAVVLVVLLVLQQANFLLSRGMLIAFGDSETTYRSAWFEWDGDIVAKDVAIYPYNLSEDLVIRFERVHLETPGWFWFVRNTFDRKLKFAKLDRIHLTLTGGASDTGFDPSLGDLGPFSLDSASPFEAEGCASDGMWTRPELVQMGLDPQPPKLEFDYRVEGNQLLTTVVLEVGGASRVQLDRRAQLPLAINALLIDQYPHKVSSERWDVQDQGFVQARNRYCAHKDGVDQNTFLARHAATVERLMEAYGIAVDAATRDSYLAFARRGGRLTLGGDYAPPIDDGEFYELRELGEAWPRMRNATLANGAQAHGIQWRHFEPRELDGLDEADSTFAALQRELATQPEATELSPTASALPAATPPAVASVSSFEAAAPATTSVSNTPTAASATPSSVPASAASQGASASADAIAAQAPTPDSAVSPAQTPASVPAAGVMPDMGAKPANVATLAAPQTAPADFLGWHDMAAQQGQKVRLWTLHNPPRLVQVLAVDADTLRIRTRLGGGDAEYTVHRASFLRARPVH
jgi:hypothetical protein